ncbi:hypothetical protein [Alkalibacillus haloalkaliphilus]|uniref:hypothetical protein n=1 Tax=Alkalibacillus haloalkaliphilus TaxID=94136 RepID=UPI0002FFF57A|nr:hypothetical protein [Alkalibacillus haloalkaliphilus]
MQQTTIYDYIGIETDPVFKKIKHLKEGQSVELGHAIVTKNEFGLYELETKSDHETADDLVDFYNKIVLQNMELSHE